MEKETSCINSRAILDYLKEYNVDCSSLFGNLDPEIDGLEDPENFLRDPSNWISCSVISKLYKRAKLILHDEKAAYKMGRYASENISLGYAQRIVFKSFWSVRKTLKNAQKINDQWNRNKKVELIELKQNEAILRLHWNPEMGVTKDICLYNQGAYTSLPLVWGGSPLTLKEKCCYFNGAQYCEYHLKWPFKNKFYETFSRLFTSKSVLMDTIKEMERDKKIIEGKTDKLTNEIEERKHAEEALRESEEKYRLLVKNITSVVYKGYKDWSVEFFDEKIELLTGYDVDEFNSKKMKWSYIIVKEDIETAREIFITALKTDKSYVREYRINYKAGGIHWIEERGHIFCDNSGEIEYISGTFFDKTEIKKLEAQLQQAQKLESVGILAGGIAHDFNNLLSIIMGNISMTKDDVKPEYGVTDFLNEAEKASLKAKELTNQLITFSKGGAPVKKVGSIGNLVKETTNLILSDSNVKSEFIFPDDLWLVEFDEGQMKHAAKNIIDNAVESMPDSGAIVVKAENFNISSGTIEKSLPLSEGKYLKISIQDHGAGIPEEHLSMIFDPYFSTKERGIEKGIGLGLATTYSIINKHDGHITAESKIGVGTTFTIYLPAAVKEIVGIEPAKMVEPEKPAVRTGRILVMDDEEMIRRLSKEMLSRLGYEPELAKNGAETIELYKRAMDSGKPFDALILDLTIKGGAGGKEVIKQLMKIDPDVKAIVSSGYSNDPVMTNFRAYGFIGALPKPYPTKDLSDMLNQVLGKS